MTIRQRIALLVTLTFLSLCVIGAYAVLKARSSEREVRTVTEGVVPSASRAVAMMAQLKDVQIATLAMVSADTPALAEQAHAAIAQRKADLLKALDDQLVSADSEAQRGLVKVAQEGLQNYFSSIDDTAKFKLAGQNEMAQANMAATVDQYLREQGEMMQALQVEKNRSKDSAIARLNDSLARTSVTLTAICAAVLALTSVAGVLLYRQVVLPIGQMEAKMTEIATHQDFSQRMPVLRHDEIGRSVVAFNTMIERIQASSEMVRQKTADIHAMLHGIPQGILTIEAGGRVHPEFSEHLRVVLEAEDFAGQDAVKLLFDGSDISADVQAQVDAVIGNCIGEDALNFEFNAHLLPQEMTRKFPSGASKVLDLHWSAMSDDQGITTRLLVCLRDVTEVRALARAAQAQQRELAIIGEVIAVQQEKFDAFIDSSSHFLVQNTRLLDRLAQGTAAERSAALAELFRNMHTVKGNARTYGLLGLADAAHRAEDRYDRLRKGHEDWHGDVLAEDLAQVRQSLQAYAKVSRETLGRSGPGRRGEVDKFFLVPREQVERLLDRLNRNTRADANTLVEVLDETRTALQAIGTERIEDALSPLLESLPALASELGKATPVVTMDDQGIRVRSQLAGVLRNAFVHLLRNALDHGIETPDQRSAVGKPHAGSIRLAAAIEGSALQLRLKDDGRGLALNRIQAQAVNRGLLQPGQFLTPQETAQFIFAAGFSTAEKVTDVSGRGVGMDAVKAFIEAEGGHIALVLEGDVRDDGFVPFQVCISLPAQLALPGPTTSGSTRLERVHA